jgi:hypothetical protein
MDPRPLPPRAIRLTNITCPECRLPVGVKTFERFGTNVYYCPACENGWSERKEPLPVRSTKR